MNSIRPIVAIAVMTKETFSSLLTTSRRQRAWFLCGIWYIYPGLWRKLIVRWRYCTPLPRIWRGVMRLRYAYLSWLAFKLTRYPSGSKSPPEASAWVIHIHVHWPFLEYCQHSPETCQLLSLQMENTRRELTPGSLSTISPVINECRIISLPDFTSCRLGLTQANMVRLQSVHLNGYWWAIQPIIEPDNVPGEPQGEDTPDEETIYPQKPDLTCTPDQTKTMADRQVVGVQNAGGK